MNLTRSEKTTITFVLDYNTLSPSLFSLPITLYKVERMDFGTHLTTSTLSKYFSMYAGEFSLRIFWYTNNEWMKNYKIWCYINFTREFISKFLLNVLEYCFKNMSTYTKYYLITATLKFCSLIVGHTYHINYIGLLLLILKRGKLVVLYICSNMEYFQKNNSEKAYRLRMQSWNPSLCLFIDLKRPLIWLITNCS